MIFTIKLLGILLGLAFPVFFIKAIEASQEEKDRKQRYIVLSSICYGIITFIIMGLLPNT